MKKLLLVLYFLGLTLITNAQSDGYWRIYPKFGLNLTKFPNDKIYLGDNQSDYEFKSRYMQGLTAGAEISYEKEALSGTLGLMYSNRGTKYGDYIYEDATMQEKVSGVQFTLHYLEMPLMGGYEVIKDFKLKAGIQIGYLLKADYMYSSIVSEKQSQGPMIITETNDVDSKVTDLFRKVDFSIPLGLSYEFSNVLIDARYVIGITTNSDYVKARNSGFTFTVGYGFDL